MDPDHRHLVRAVSHAGTIRDLAGPSGLARLAFDELNLVPGEALILEPHATAEEAVRAPGAECFVYVRSGRGVLTTPDERTDVVAGDLIGFRASAGCTLACTDDGLVCLCGGEKGGYAWQRLESEQ